MSVRKLRLFAMLGMMLAFAALVLAGSLSYLVDQSARRPGSSPRNTVPEIKSGFPQAAFLPVQSTEAKDLGPGKLLVATRELGDPNFVHTVILLVDYDDKGVLGLILNRRTRVPLSQVLEGLKAARDRPDPVYLGGPVDKPAIFALLHSPAKVEGAQPVVDGVYLISTKALFEQTIAAQADPKALHVYLGYAGWSNEQLRQEVELGSWFIFPADAKTVFDADPDSLWSRMIGKTELEIAARRPAP